MTEETPSKRRRQPVRFVLKLLLWLLVGVVVLVVAVYLVLQTGPGRSLVRDLVLREVNEAIQGTLQVESIETISLFSVRLTGVSLLDPAGNLVAEVAEVRAEVDLGALFGGALEVGDVVVRDPHLILEYDDEGVLTLLAAVASTSPPAPEPQPRVDVPSGEPMLVRLARVIVTGGRVTTRLPEAYGLGVSQLDLVGRLRLTDTIEIRVGQLALTIEGPEGPLLRLDPLRGQFNTATGKPSRARFGLNGARDRIAGEVSVGGLTDGGPLRLDARLDLHRVTPTLLRTLGLDEVAEQAPAWVSGVVEAHGTLDDLVASVALETPGGEVAVAAHGQGFETIDVTVDTEGLALHDVSSLLPEMRVSASVTVAMRPTGEPETRRFEVRLATGALDEYRIPALELDAVLSPEAVVVDSLRLPELAHRFNVSGRYDLDTGEARAAIRIEELDVDKVPNLAAIDAPDARGRISADLDVHFVPGEEAQIEVDGALSVRRLRFAELVAERLEVRGSASGELLHPRVDLRVRATDVGSGDTVVSAADLHVVGGPRDYQLDGDVALRDGPEASLDIDASWHDERLGLSGSLSVRQDGEELRAELRNVAFEPDRLVEVGRLHLTHPDADLSLSGSYDFRSGADAELEITRLELGLFDGRMFLPDLGLGGRVTGQLTLRGQPDDPRGRVDVRWQGGSAGPLEEIYASLSVVYESTGVELDGRVEIADQLSIRVSGNGAFDRAGRPPQEAVTDADWDLSVELDADDLAVVSQIAPDSPVQGGAIVGTISLRGGLASPSINAELTGTALAVAGAPTVDFWTLVRIDSTEVTAALDSWDENGRLLTLRGSAQLGWDDLLSGDLTERLAEAAMSLEAEVPRRRLDSFDVAVGPLEEVPLEVSLTAELDRAPRMLPTGELHLQVRSPNGELREGACPKEQPIDLVIDAVLREGESSFATVLTVGEREAMRWTASASTPFTEWVDSGLTDLPAVVSEIVLDELDLGGIPLACDESAGSVSGTLSVTDLLTDEPVAHLDLTSRSLTLGGARAFNAEVEAELTSTRATFEALGSAPAMGRLRATADAPVVWNAAQLIPELGEGPLSARVDLETFSLAPLAGVVPTLSRGVGTVDGFVEVSGSLDDLQPSGDLQLADVVLTVQGLDQRLSGVRGRITLSPSELRLDNVRAGDREGTIRLDGVIQMDGLSPRQAELTVTADNFPTRQAGLIVARLTALARATADFSGESVEVHVVFDELGIRLPEQAARNVQGLELNSDIRFVDEAGLAAWAEQQAEAGEPLPRDASELVDLAAGEGEPGAEGAPATEPAGAPAETQPMVLLIDATNPFWVRRSDFSVQLTADLRIDVDADGLRLSGPVELRRGFLDLLTKTFELSEGNITFTGGRDIDPILNIVAVYELTRYPGQSVTATITGRLSQPDLSFSTTVAGVETDAEIIALVITGRIDSEEAATSSQPPEAQVASFLGGLTAGLLTMTARNELGDAVPLISVQSGQDLRDVQVRAGFVADTLIPSFMRNVVTGMYIEGFVGTSSEESGEQETEQVTTGGVLIELYFPNGWLMSGTFQPPTNWSLDVLWQP